MNEMKQKQGESEEDAPRCPPHRFVFGSCLSCGMKKKDAEVTVGHETMKRRRDGNGEGEGDGDAANCPPHPGFVHGLCFRCGAEEEAGGGGAPAVAVGHETMKQGGDGDGDDYAASRPSHAGFVGDENARRSASGDGVTVAYFRGEEDAGGSTSGGGVTVAYIEGKGPELPALEAAMNIASASDRATLMRERKLILILDLDHTLLNSTKVDKLTPDEQLHGLTPETLGEPDINLYRLDLDLGVQGGPMPMLVKLRPFAEDFLQQASAMFEMHVYTMGNRVYARAAVALLDPERVYFRGRIVSRDESTRRNAKSLDAIQGAEPNTVVILDDSDHVWPEHLQLRNLILIDRYHYFASSTASDDTPTPSLSEQGSDESGHDDGPLPLAVVLDVLKRVHQAFFDGDRADVRDVIAEMRRQVLPGCTVVFSFLEQFMGDFTEHDDAMRTLVERLGGTYLQDVDDTVTHVVAEDPGSPKAQWAREHRKFLVNPDWVQEASFRWSRPDELKFPVNFPNLL